MPSVIELLVADGILDRRRKSEINEAQAIYGGSIDTNLLETGLIEERQLQIYLERANGVPNRIDVMGEADAAAVALLRRQQAEKYRVVPFSLEGRVLDVVVNDPTDVRALDEVAFITGCRLVVNVATEMRVSFHLFASYQIGLPHRLQQLLMRKPVPKPPPLVRAVDAREEDHGDGERPSVAMPPIADAPRVVPSPPRPDLRSFTPPVGTAIPVVGAPPPSDAPIEVPLPPPKLPLPLPPEPAASAPSSAASAPSSAASAPSSAASAPSPVATLQGLPPFADYPEFQETPPSVTLPGSPDASTPRPTLEPVRRNYEAIERQLEEIVSRDEIPAIVLSYLGALCTRVALFTVRKNLLVGWDARGPRLRRESVETVAFRLDRPSVFEAVLVGGVPFEGRLPQDDVEESLVIKLGDEEWPEHVLIVPIQVKDRPVAMIYGEAASAEALVAAREPATVLAQLVTETFVRLILRKKTMPPV